MIRNMARAIQRNVGKAALVAGAAVATVQSQAALTNDPTTITSSVLNDFDLGAGIGLTILGFLLGLGAIITGVKVYRRRG